MSMTLLALGLLMANDPVQAPTAAAPAGQRRICRAQERLGTILPRRVCRTADEWAQIDAAQDRISTRDSAHMRNNSRGSLARDTVRNGLE